ncbi:protein of unknown function DUF182 [Sulfobacillus acidophilus TPY]|uniref:YHS domain-containing protein n=1 Tax=Sulfobacillus acidophilus (strain ATCC 700253 / DSM 10332 / NAL) TaxID=679936 RepID=G8TYS0_SULAD|nr:protein of unknown function DUF182 [Sulfobacillus acidophilus TPY]AEW04035.1 YHS domain-containing protein [Sulfobacillus acidophilus DSM 10332]
MDAVLQEAARLDLAQEPYVMVTVVRTVPPTSATVGARALVSVDRKITGYVGGECTRRILLEVVEEALADGRPRILLLTPDSEGSVRDAGQGILVKPMTCHSGGTVELFVEPRLADPVLLVVGDSPVAQSLAELAAQLPFTVRRASMSEADDWESLKNQIEQHAVAGSYVVVATMGQYDDWAIDVLRDVPIQYLGVVASPRRGELLRQRFEQGQRQDEACVVSVPAGLDLGSRHPGEIAVSILAEIIQIRRQHGAVPVVRVAAPPEDDLVVTDPVCHMQVKLRETPYRTRYGGKEWGFCAQSCLDAFLQEPERYLGN